MWVGASEAVSKPSMILGAGVGIGVEKDYCLLAVTPIKADRDTDPIYLVSSGFSPGLSK
jgi:hypothetical protein